MFEDIIDDLLNGAFKTLERVVEPGRSNSEGIQVVHPVPRLMVCLEGQRFYRFMVGGEWVELTHGPGEALFVAPHRWLSIVPREAYLVMGILFLPDHIRFTLAQHDPAKSYGSNFTQGTTLDWRHAPRAFNGLLPSLSNFLSEDIPHPALLDRAAFELLLFEAQRALEQPQTRGGKALGTFQALCHHIEENCHLSVTRESAATALRLHPSHISRLFARFDEGGSFGAYLLRARLSRARELLRDPALNIGEVARASGFANAGHFTHAFRRAFLVTPSQWRRSPGKL